MDKLYSIIRSPIITERGTDLKERFNKVIFSVAVGTNKREIKKAIERFFKVTVEKVNTINQAGKRKRFGKNIGQRAAWKKAVVTLKKGQKIELLEGV
ncbi:MAG: 50S ribosomal protein L23 [Nitrospinota bacterium]